MWSRLKSLLAAPRSGQATRSPLVKDEQKEIGDVLVEVESTIEFKVVPEVLVEGDTVPGTSEDTNWVVVIELIKVSIFERQLEITVETATEARVIVRVPSVRVITGIMFVET